MRSLFSSLRIELTGIRPIVMHSICLYFAPITGAVKGIRQEYRRLNRREIVWRAAGGRGH